MRFKYYSDQKVEYTMDDITFHTGLIRYCFSLGGKQAYEILDMTTAKTNVVFEDKILYIPKWQKQ